MEGRRSGTGTVESVNVGSVRTVEWNGRPITTGIFKEPVAGRRTVRGVNVDGDEQADRRVHGGPDMAVYVYAAEDYGWWGDELGRRLGPGTFGENLTLRGVSPTGAVLGERWRIGTTVLRVTQPRLPCYKLGIRMGDPRFPSRFAAAARPGTYLAIEQEGDVGAGDAVEIVSRPDHGITVGDVERAYHDDRGRVPHLLVDDLPDGWRQWAQKVLAHRAD